jgi:phospholipase A1
MIWNRYAAATTVMLLLVLHNATGQAADPPACATIKDNNQRLECYDKQAGSTAPPTGGEDKAVNTGVNTDEEPGEGSIVEKRLEQESRTAMSEFAITAHKPNYFLPFTYTNNPNNDSYDTTADGGESLQRVEVKFQLSFKVPLVKRFLVDNGQLWFAYSQLAFWQMYNRDLSSPFRETDYEPELLWTLKTDNRIAGFRNSYVTLALNHQSNGRSDPLSRSWNRIKADFVFEKENFVLSVNPWYRIPDDKEDDDNPDIEAYLGYADFGALYKYKEHLSTILFRNNLRSGDNRSTIELTYTFQFNKRLKGIAQYFNGYGESLIDYNHRIQRFGVGILLTDWL